jgi:hypothetical protein
MLMKVWMNFNFLYVWMKQDDEMYCILLQFSQLIVLKLWFQTPIKQNLLY